MKSLRCAGVRRQLGAFHDGELSVPDRVSVAHHLQSCRSCAAQADQLRFLGTLLKEGAQAGATDVPDLVSMRDGIVGRFEAEREASLEKRVGLLFEDMHLVWAGLSATAATVTCAAILFAMWFLSPPERADSLAGMLSALSAPASETPGVDAPASPARVKRSNVNGVMPAMLPTTATEADLVVALADVVTQPRRIAGANLIVSKHLAHDVLLLMNAINEARIQNATLIDDPAAVNFVWLRRDAQGRTALALHGWLTHTMVRGKVRS